MRSLRHAMHATTHFITKGPHAGRESERGDVPGWVLVTIMTAGLVAALWVVASPLLTQLFRSAVESVSGPGA